MRRHAELRSPTDQHPGTVGRLQLARLRRMFRTVKGFKPKASRDTSTEIYVIAHGFRGRDTTAPTEDAAPERALPPRKPSTGWS